MAFTGFHDLPLAIQEKIYHMKHKMEMTDILSEMENQRCDYLKAMDEIDYWSHVLKIDYFRLYKSKSDINNSIKEKIDEYKKSISTMHMKPFRFLEHKFHYFEHKFHYYLWRDKDEVRICQGIHEALLNSQFIKWKDEDEAREYIHKALLNKYLCYKLRNGEWQEK